MARRPSFKRQTGKDGVVRYFQLKKDKRGVEVYKRVSDKKGASAFVKKNYKTLKNTNKNDLTKQEQKSLNRSRGQRELKRYKGKAIPKWKSDYLESKFPALKKVKDYSKVNEFKRRADVEQSFMRLIKNELRANVESGYGLPNWRGRQQVENIVKIKEELEPFLESGYEVEVLQGAEAYFGNQAWSVIKTFELNTLSQAQKKGATTMAFFKFDYPIIVDQDRKRIEINLNNVKPKPMFSDPIRRVKK